MKAFAVSTTTVVIVMLFIGQHWAVAQGTQQLLEGKTYMVAFPQVIAAPSEKPMPQPMQLIISSRTDATVWISSPAVINDTDKIDRTFKVLANKTIRIPIPIGYMNVDSEKRKGYGILVDSDKPISVSTYQAWMGNGEISRHLPTEAWGKSYYSMNMYQDRYGRDGVGYKYRPSQILVVAALDNTVVSYTPTVDTEGGIECPSVRRGATQTVTLERGETFLIKSKIDTTKLREWSTDLSATFIRSSKPIGVVSGHTKCSVLRYPDVLPPTGMLASEAHFVRSNVHDVMFPIEYAGSSFVTIPCMYTPVRGSKVGTNASSFGIEDDRGDLIRVIAIDDGTVVKSMNPQGSGIVTEWTLNKGETRTTTREYPVYWESNKPILIGQYGKSYAKINAPRRDENKELISTQGHPTIESGMPMLQTVPSTDRWINYGAFYSPEGMDNFFNIVFNTKDVDKVNIDGHRMLAAFGAGKTIPGTNYSFISTPIGTGDHYVESTDSSVRWMAWNYGSLDGLQQGRAYGSPVGIDLAIPCNDSVTVTDQISCGDVTSKGSVSGKTTGCGSIFALYTSSIDNYDFKVDENFVPGDQQIPYTLTVVDKTKDASAVVRVVSRSGKYLERRYTYQAVKLGGVSDVLDFGVVRRNDTAVPARTFTVTNEYDDRIVTVNAIRFTSGTGAFSLDTVGPLKLGPLKSRDVIVRANFSKINDGVVVDTLVLDVDCNSYKSEIRLTCEPAQPLISINNLDWDNSTEAPYKKRKKLVIRNDGDGVLIIRDYERTKLNPGDLTNHFFTPVPIDSVLPLSIAPKDSFEVDIEYSSRGEADVLHKQSVTFYSNAAAIDSVCSLTGVAWSSVSAQTNDGIGKESAVTIRPNPATDNLELFVLGNGNIEYRIMDLLGNTVVKGISEHHELDITQEPIDVRALPNGRYTVVVRTSREHVYRQLLIIR